MRIETPADDESDRALEATVAEEEREFRKLTAGAIRQPINYGNLPVGSLQLLAEGLNKSQKQVKRYCEDGLVPDAFRTPKGHWRIRYTIHTLAKTKEAISKFARRTKCIQKSKLWAEIHSPRPSDEDFIYPWKKAMKIGWRAHEVGFAISVLHYQGEELTPTKIAAFLGISRTTLYARLPKGALRQAIRAQRNYVDQYEPQPRSYRKVTINYERLEAMPSFWNND